jgi:hypothetical protein
MKAKVSILPGTPFDRLRRALQEEEGREIPLDGGVDDKWAVVKELGAVLAYLDEVKMEPDATRLIRLWGALGDSAAGRREHPLLAPVDKKKRGVGPKKKRGVGRPPKETFTDREKEIRTVAALAMQLFMDCDMPRDLASEEVGIAMTEVGRQTEPSVVRHWRDEYIGRTDNKEGKERFESLAASHVPSAIQGLIMGSPAARWSAALGALRELRLLIRIS